jgi:hypothetical protein
VTNTAFGAELTGEYGFAKGAVYEITLEHHETDTNYTHYPESDYDYQVYLNGQGGTTGWTFGAGFALSDTNGILGDHHETDQTEIFDASNKTARLHILLTDIDVDMDCDGTFSVTDDVAEAVSPGKVVGVNWDDDNTNGVLDWLDTGTDTNEDDLVEIRLSLGPTNLSVGQVVLEIADGTNLVNVWDSPWKGDATNCLVGPEAGTNLCIWTVGPTGTIATLGDFAYTNFWVEGLTNSLTNCEVEIVFRYEDTDGVCRSADTNVLTIAGVDIVQSNATGVARAGTNLYFNLTADSWTNCIWEIDPDLGTNGALFAASATNDGSTNVWSGTDVWVDPGNTVTDFVITAYANEATNCYDTVDLNVLSGRVYIAFGHIADDDGFTQSEIEDTALSNLTPMVSNIMGKGYEVTELRECTTSDYEDMLGDNLLVGLVWFAHGAVVCQPENTNCQREVSRVWSYDSIAGAGDKLWVSNWVDRLADKKLCTLWMLSCGSSPTNLFHLACSCTNCGVHICPSHPVTNPSPSCAYCADGYRDGGTTNFHSAASPPTTLITFESEKGAMVRAGGWFRGYSYAWPPDPSDTYPGSETVEDDQNAFNNALP